MPTTATELPPAPPAALAFDADADRLVQRNYVPPLPARVLALLSALLGRR